jgi:hypothetical protein
MCRRWRGAVSFAGEHAAGVRGRLARGGQDASAAGRGCDAGEHAAGGGGPGSAHGGQAVIRRARMRFRRAHGRRQTAGKRMKATAGVRSV